MCSVCICTLGKQDVSIITLSLLALLSALQHLCTYRNKLSYSGGVLRQIK